MKKIMVIKIIGAGADEGSIVDLLTLDEVLADPLIDDIDRIDYQRFSQRGCVGFVLMPEEEYRGNAYIQVDDHFDEFEYIEEVE